MESGRYDVLVIDPPWPQKKGGRRSVRPRQGRALPYRVMTIGESFDLLRNEVLPLASPRHVVFLWCIDKFLHEVEAVVEDEFGYSLHARLIWDKGNGVAPAFTVRYSHEYLLWLYKPTLMPVAEWMRGKATTVFREAPREHGRKPDISYRLIESLYPEARRLEVFARQRRPGWDSWGDEVDHFASE